MRLRPLTSFAARGLRERSVPTPPLWAAVRRPSLTADRTTFAIAHRLSTVRDADRVRVMDDGRSTEQGTHEELLAADGLSANRWSVQVGEVDALSQEFVERERPGVGDD
jgi:ATP-binding cassette subfamily B protein